ncbi:alpha/beta fold hydrolase [Gracilibacillus timonensis]|uniref:alpha/beta fold hydrolase n=1 Tax=Gracilibacillus timonensis TaxID=1816696 RepID=UPI00082479D5|nr:alpha/beta hydrolase [Gracilibacillus timonensis]
MERWIGTYTVDGYTIEYSVTGKIGTPVLVMRGGHSNCHEEFGYSFLIKNGFTIITPSRAGYGKTSKEMGEDLSKACAYYVKLLDYLKMDKVHLLAISAGGPSGLYLASHYPERVKTLTLQSAVTKEWLTPEDNIYKIAQTLFRPPIEKITWKLVSRMSNLFPTFMFKMMAPSFSNLSNKKIKSKRFDTDMEAIQRMNNRQRSVYGFLIDLSTKEITIKNLQAITCLTLIMHSRHDGAVPLEHASYADQHIPHSQLCLLETWGHLIWLGHGSEQVNEKLVEFLTDYVDE